MPAVTESFVFKVLFASLVVGALGVAAAKGVAPIAASFTATPPAALPTPAAVSPSAAVMIPPAPPAVVASHPKPATMTAVPKPVDKPAAVAAAHHSAAHHAAKFSSLVKRLAAAHAHAAKTAGVIPPHTPVPPPPEFAEPGPYQRLVYGGLPAGPFGDWGYRGRYFYYP